MMMMMSSSINGKDRFTIGHFLATNRILCQCETDFSMLTFARGQVKTQSDLRQDMDRLGQDYHLTVHFSFHRKQF